MSPVAANAHTSPATSPKRGSARLRTQVMSMMRTTARLWSTVAVPALVASTDAANVNWLRKSATPKRAVSRRAAPSRRRAAAAARYRTASSRANSAAAVRARMAVTKAGVTP